VPLVARWELMAHALVALTFGAVLVALPHAVADRREPPSRPQRSPSAVGGCEHRAAVGQRRSRRADPSNAPGRSPTTARLRATAAASSYRAFHATQRAFDAARRETSRPARLLSAAHQVASIVCSAVVATSEAAWPRITSSSSR